MYILRSKSLTPLLERIYFFIACDIPLAYPPDGYELLIEEIGNRVEIRWREVATGVLSEKVYDFARAAIQAAHEHSKRDRWKDIPKAT